MNKTIPIIIGVIIILVIGGFYYSKTSAIGITIPRSIGKMTLPTGFSTRNYSNERISLAEEKISEIEIKLIEVKAKDLSEYDFLHRQFLSNMIGKMEKMLAESKENLEKAKQAFEEEDYFNASQYAQISRNIAVIIPNHLNKILEGRTKEQWNRLTSVEV